MSGRLGILAAWLDTKMALRLGTAGLRRRQERLWRRMAAVVARTPALADHAGLPLHRLPIVDAGDMRDDVARWNSVGIGHDAALLASLNAETGVGGFVTGDVVAGLSTGTSGRRGLFLASGAERSRQVGQSIARLLPASALAKGARIALVLRADSALYGDVRQGRFDFLHVPLGLSAADMHARLVTFAPTVLIAPPRELAALAAYGMSLPDSLQRVFWGSEPIAPVERAALSRHLGLRIDPIYQATEGFVGSACAHGSLHLNEDSIHVELEPVDGTDAFRPIVTDLMRTTQPMVRVRLDDLVRPVGTRCSCGSARKVVEPVLGRVQDVWHVDGRAITPEAVDDHFAGALPDHAVWRVQGSPDGVRVEIVDERDRAAVISAVAAIHPSAGIAVEKVPELTGPKRRRITWESES